MLIKKSFVSTIAAISRFGYPVTQCKGKFVDKPAASTSFRKRDKQKWTFIQL